MVGSATVCFLVRGLFEVLLGFPNGFAFKIVALLAEKCIRVKFLSIGTPNITGVLDHHLDGGVFLLIDFHGWDAVDWIRSVGSVEEEYLCR